ncbi:MAG: phenylalanyl-tRNA synthetase beta chain [Rhodothermales bacterium]|jgi:phenylalanyl-tRNA synthetase beta chain
MRISCNWIADYVRTDWTPEELGDRLTMSGLEVETIDQMGSELKGVIIGHVLEAEQHPDADRLKVCKVDLGDGPPVQIVCGAPNVAAGQRVPVATEGTVLQLPDRKDPDMLVPVTIKKSKIRGQESRGMICAEDELGLGEDHDGIMVLADDAPLGESFSAYMAVNGVKTSDVSIDLAITPNRPDAICHLGVARDVGALAQVPVTRPDVAIPSEGGEAADAFTVQIDAPDGCHRYTGILVRGVTVGESPQWLKSRLESVGLRPLNNIVDITNYVMYECGQPLHGFDFDQVAGAQIIVRRSAAGETFTTLDGKERDLPTGTLLIADGERPVAVAGVMGGENSEVSGTTTNVLIESAWFNPSDIRKAAKALQLQTDASYRFERGVDPTGQAWAAARAAELMRDLAGGTIVDGMVDCHPVHWEQSTLSLRHARITTILGIEIPREDCQRLLEAIGFGVSPNDAGWSVTVPPFRPDVEREIDLIEEVARLYGLEQIPVPSHGSIPNLRPAPPKPLPARLRLANRLVGMGYREIYTNSMMRLDLAARFASESLRGGEPVGDIVATLNPISQEMAALRPSLLPGALQVAAHNLNHGQTGISTFEFGHVFDRSDTEGHIIPGYREQEHVLLLRVGSEGKATWNAAADEADIFDLKGAVADILNTLGVTKYKLEAEPSGSDLTRYHLNLRLGRRRVGTIGCVSADLAAEYSIDTPVFFAELNFSTLVAATRQDGAVAFQPVSRFPVVERDLALLVSRAEPVGAMLDTVNQYGGKLLLGHRVFDIYEGDRIEEDKKSVAIGLAFGADRTLKDTEVDKAVQKIVNALGKQHAAELRR